MILLRRVVGSSLRNRVRNSVTWEKLRVELLLLHIVRSQLRLLSVSDTHWTPSSSGVLAQMAMFCDENLQASQFNITHVSRLYGLNMRTSCSDLQEEIFKEQSLKLTKIMLKIFNSWRTSCHIQNMATGDFFHASWDEI